MFQTTPDLRSRLVLDLMTLYILLLFAIPARLIIGPLGSAGAPSMILGVVIALVWLLAQLQRTTTDLSSRRPIRIALGAFLASVGLSYAIAMTGPIDHEETSPADLALLVALACSGVLLMAHDGLADLRAVSTLVRRLAIGGGAMACVALAEVVTGQALVDTISIPGLRNTGSVELSYRYGLLRMSGTAASPIEFGALLTILLPLATHNALYPSVRSRVIRWFPVAAISLALVLSLSRSAYIGLACALVILTVGWPRRLRRRVATLLILVFALMIVVVPQVFRAVRAMFLGAADDPSITSRTDSYAVVWHFFLESPWFGRGLGTFLPKYSFLDNQYLGLLVSIGILGLLAFLGVLLVTIALLLRHRRRWSDDRHRDLALSLTAGITAGGVSFAFFDAFVFPMAVGTLFLTLGISGALLRLRPDEKKLNLKSSTTGRLSDHRRVSPARQDTSSAPPCASGSVSSETRS